MGATESTEAPREVEQSEGNADTVSYETTPSALVICGPSGVGKGTLIKELMKGSENYAFSCSHTTRAPRAGEEDGVHYHFVSREHMEKEIQEGHFLEYAHVHRHIYGTSIQAVQQIANAGKSCVLDIDVQGARQVRKCGLKAVFVFVAPPSVEELERRLRARATETEEQIQTRLQTAREEMASLEEEGLYDYVIYNDNLEEAQAQLAAIAQSAHEGRVGNGKAVNLAASALDTTEPASQEPAVAPEPDVVAAADTPEEAGNIADTPALNTQHDMSRWRGKVALVTGASAGIGWAVCETLALQGFRVVAVARRRERLEQLQQQVVAKGVSVANFLPVVCDITKEAEVVALPRIILKRWPDAGVDVLVNNAGLARNNGSLFSGNTTSWVEMISTNVLALSMCTREAVQDMKRRDAWGHIINISSLSGHRVPPGGSAFYAATKHAVRALTEGLRQEARSLGVPLRVSSISPGMVETEFTLVSAFGDLKEENKAQLQRLQPTDIAQAVLWCLASPAYCEVNDVLIRPTAQIS